MRRIKCTLRVALFCGLLVLVFGSLQQIFTPYFRYPRFSEAPYDMLEEYKELAETTDIQALFLGTSHAEYSIDPMAIYEKTGIVTYNMATNSQDIGLSKALLEWAFEYQQPEYVFLDVSAAFYGTNYQDTAWRYVLDSMSFDRNKIRMARRYSEIFGGEHKTSVFLNAIFPMIKYHDRWAELSTTDWKDYPDETTNFYRKGFFSLTRISSGYATVDEMNAVADILASEDSFSQTIIDDEVTHNDWSESINNPNIIDEIFTLVEEISEICNVHGSKLVLIKVPAINYPNYYHASWTSLRSEKIKEMSEKLDVPFYDFLYDCDLAIDWSTMTWDQGGHLNYYGAEILSDFFASFLRDTFALQGGLCEAYEEDIPLYTKIHSVIDLQKKTTLIEYIDKLLTLPDTAILISASDDMKNALSDETIAAMKRLGLQTDFDQLSFANSYAAVIDDQDVVYESMSNRKINYSGTLSNSAHYELVSSGFYAGAWSQIGINGTNYSISGRGVNIVVYDMTAGKVIDSVSFDTFSSSNPQSTRNYDSCYVYLYEYEAWAMDQDWLEDDE